MIPAPLIARRLARLCLLIAVALHFASAAAGPLAHLPPVGDAPSVERPGERGPDAPAAHEELSCALCHTLLVLAPPVAAQPVPLPLLATPADLPPSAARPSAGAPLRPSARAPPLS